MGIVVLLVAGLLFLRVRFGYFSGLSTPSDDDKAQPLLHNDRLDNVGTGMEMGPVTSTGSVGSKATDIRTSDTRKYGVGQHVTGLAGGTVSGVVSAIRPDTPGGAAGPGTISVEPFLKTTVQPVNSNVQLQSTNAPPDPVRVLESSGPARRCLTPAAEVVAETGVDEAAVPLDPIQTYRVRLGFQLNLRKEADHKGVPTGVMLTQGSTFEVDMIKLGRRARGDGGDQTFLHAVNVGCMDQAGVSSSVTGGWAFQYHPTSGKDVCELAWNTSTNTLDFSELQVRMISDK
jgi:hypothetical protein